MTARRWARYPDSVADILRRGAWFPIVEETSDGKVVVDVRTGKRVRLSLSAVTVRQHPPDQWSVVTRTGVLRPTLGGKQGSEVDTTYGVCPHCHERQEFAGKPARLKCSRCGRESAVGWSQSCLGAGGRQPSAVRPGATPPPPKNPERMRSCRVGMYLVY